MNSTIVNALEQALTVKRQRLSMTHSPRSRDVLKRDVQRLKHLSDEFRARPL